MPIKKILKKERKEKPLEEEFIELPEVKEERKVRVRIEELNSYRDSERIQQLVREGTIVFLRIKDLRNKDITELKRAVERLKRTCAATGGDIVGVDEDYLIVTPNFAKIYRGK